MNWKVFWIKTIEFLNLSVTQGNITLKWTSDQVKLNVNVILKALKFHSEKKSFHYFSVKWLFNFVLCKALILLDSWHSAWDLASVRTGVNTVHRSHSSMKKACDILINDWIKQVPLPFVLFIFFLSLHRDASFLSFLFATQNNASGTSWKPHYI